MKSIIENLIDGIIVFFWLAGIAIAKGFWSTTFAITLPPYAWYLCVKKAVEKFL